MMLTTLNLRGLVRAVLIPLIIGWLVAGAGRDGLPRLQLVWSDGAHAGTLARWLETE